MKYAVVLCDGMADYPIESLGGKTPMAAADKPAMDALVAKAEVGLVKTVPDGIAPGSDVANLSVMGYDPAVYYTGRSPLEEMCIRDSTHTAETAWDKTVASAAPLTPI